MLQKSSFNAMPANFELVNYTYNNNYMKTEDHVILSVETLKFIRKFMAKDSYLIIINLLIFSW